MASGRLGRSSCRWRQSSSTSSSAGGKRTPTSVEPTGGRPGLRFLLSDIADFAIDICYQKKRLAESVNFRVGSHPHQDSATTVWYDGLKEQTAIAQCRLRE